MLLYITTLLALTKTVISQGPNPCPELFSYEPIESGSDRWYGEIRYSSPENITGIWLQIEVDRPADIIGNWFGQVTTCDNMAFSIRKPGHRLQVGQHFSLRFFVKFNLAKPIPSLKAIKLNGKDICTEEKSKQNFEPLHSSELGKNDEVAEIVNVPSDSDQYVTQGSRTDFLREDSCGIPASRATLLIYEGQDTSPGQWPWHAALYHHGTVEIKYACGATLITRQHVVTAAHCVTDLGTKTIKDIGDISIGLGKYDLKTYEEDFQHAGVSDIYVHPQYNPWKLFNDIAILKLSEPVQITNYVRPCCLWDEDSHLVNIIGRAGTVVGWGINENSSHRLLQAALPVVSTEQCFTSKEEFRAFLNENNFCAGNRNGTAACRGDSGGGMVFPKNDETGQTVWYLRGIVSLSLVPKKLCETSHYNIFTDVAKFLPWINSVISK